ncbi:hypothetical protein ACFPOG_10550 [Paenibacillus aestuarii]|uniref:Uncharacterized protein n=1 Tax=Paenibacillus aestuarii TaxID=516965 RepID=A0ABW0K634_9BACL
MGKIGLQHPRRARSLMQLGKIGLQLELLTDRTPIARALGAGQALQSVIDQLQAAPARILSL